MIFGIIILYIGILIFLFASYWRLFEKAGKPGWAAIIPIYNILVLADVARVERKNAWLFIAFYSLSVFANAYFSIIIGGSDAFIYTILAMVFVFVGLFFLFKIWKGVAKSFGQSSAFVWGLLFLNIIFVPILAFGSATYQNEGVYTNQDVLDSDF